MFRVIFDRAKTHIQTIQFKSTMNLRCISLKRSCIKMVFCRDFKQTMICNGPSKQTPKQMS